MRLLKFEIAGLRCIINEFATISIMIEERYYSFKCCGFKASIAKISYRRQPLLAVGTIRFLVLIVGNLNYKNNVPYYGKWRQESADFHIFFPCLKSFNSA